MELRTNATVALGLLVALPDHRDPLDSQETEERMECPGSREG